MKLPNGLVRPRHGRRGNPARSIGGAPPDLRADTRCLSLTNSDVETADVRDTRRGRQAAVARNVVPPRDAHLAANERLALTLDPGVAAAALHRGLPGYLTAAHTRFAWHELNAQHAFLRDLGHRYDPALATMGYGIAIELFRRKLGDGDLTG